MRAVAAKVDQHGSAFEGVLREREKRNEKFAFLRDSDVRTGSGKGLGGNRADTLSRFAAAGISPLPFLWRLAVSAAHTAPG